VLIGSLQAHVSGAGTLSTRVSFTAAARRGLARLRRFALVVDASPVSTAGVPGGPTEIRIRLRR
jgi:hypothetical protein